MKLLGTLEKKQHIFDPAKAEHRSAYWRLRTTGRQDTELRFLLEPGFTNIITMMQQKIADHFSKPVEAKAAAVMADYREKRR